MTHIPVLLKESIEILNPRDGEFFIDGTIGSGGHSAAILEKIGPSGKLLGIDWDKNAIERLRIGKFKNCKNIILVNANYADLPEILEKNNLPQADGLIVDLGFSSTQIESSGKGFSFLKNEPLDMRYGNEDLTAAEVINSFSEKDLADLIFKYGEERFSRQIAKKIVDERKKERILTTFQLVEIIKKALPAGRQGVPKNYEKGRINPATRTFQALRIYVNRELENVQTLLENLEKILKPQGRAAIISFHSLEDRLVKNYFRDLAKNEKAEILTKKPITASDEEIKENPRSRSAKMRAIRAIANNAN
ncbi:16S rRNA (cytosine(1402)-N(4))-methyltransferase RsmH [Candidatus Wolfebacteria bacterium]|nr:16S rRNA (cytosine(1402)-N(4))-methyltransferase RsmH [Candidatus Wolfebacteria bacterium]